MSANLSTYIYAHTSGLISKTSPIKIRFNSVVSGENAAGILQLNPSVKGSASWEDEYTLLFQPNEPLESSTTYIGTVDLTSLFKDLPKDAQSFEFDFRTKDQYFDVNVDGLYAPNPKELGKQVLSGKVITADLAADETVEKILTAYQNKTKLAINWVHLSEQEHQFKVENINRNASPQTVQLKWNGAALKVDNDGEEEIEVPALGDFKVTRVNTLQNQDQYISLYFSDPLRESQNLDGLITVSDYNGTLRYLIEGQELRIYPAQRLVGNHKIQINSAIKNINGQRMKNAGEWLVEFQDIKPQVRLVGQGVIMPNSKGLIFPFEAVSLNAIELEIFKIYNNNILQFLQNNQINGGYNLETVGRIIMQKKIDLNSLNPTASSTEWSRYALDLEPLIQQDPEAIYQVRIGFRPSYSNYFCSNTANEEDTELDMIQDPFTEDGEITSIMDSWYGIDGWYEGYNWQQRENPCFPAYYNSDNFLRRNVVASNLGIIAKGGQNNNFFVTVTDIRTTEPISNAEIAFYDYQQQLLKTVQTDGQGIAQAQLERTPFVAVATQGNQKGYLRLADGNSLSMSRFDVSGAVSQKGMKGYLYAERGVWRPGDSIFLNFVLEDKNSQLPANYPISFELYDPRGQLQKRSTVSYPVGNVYPLHFRTMPDAPTGSWVAKVKAGGALFDKVLRVETVKPNRIKIDLDFGQKSLSKAQEPLNVRLQANWLHGAPARNLKAKVEVELKSKTTSFESYSNYKFDDPARSFYASPKVLFDNQLDDQGYANFSSNLINNQNAPGQLSANFKTRVFEKSGDFSTDNYTTDYNPYSTYTGISIPENQYGEKRMDINQAGELNFVAVDNQGKALANRKLKVGLYRVEWRWWWDNGYDNVSRYNTSNHYDAQQTADLVTNSRGEISWSTTVDDWGRYLVRICDQESGHCSGDYFYAGYPWYGEDNQYREAAAMMTFTSDKMAYDVGETVKLNIPTGQVGKALVTIENGSNVLESFWFESKEGENEFSFKTTEAMTPTAYAHVALIQPHAKVENDLPIRLYGVIPIKVEDEKTKLKPTLKMPEELQPNQTFTVEVGEDNGQPMAYTIAVVDEGLLSLTRFKTPNPWDVFYAREALGVHTWDVYDQVLGAYGGDLERVLNIGGGLELKPKDADSKANRFEPVVRHLGPFQLKKGKKAKHEITLPNYVGAVRTMVVAANDGAYGSAEKTSPVRKPLMVLATLPRVLSPGEQLKLPVNVFAMDRKVKNVSVQLEESSGLANIVNGNTQNISFNQAGDQLVNFDVNIGEGVGVAKFKVTASGNGETASQEIEIQVRNPNPVLTDVFPKILQEGENWSKSFDAVGMTGTNDGVLEISSIPPINLGKRLDYLLRYPYGCIEQTISSGFPQLYVGQLLDLNERQKEKIPNNIKATIDRVKQFQTSPGGFAYWPGQTTPDHWGSNYAGHFLLEAQALGYAIPAGILENWAKFQKKTAKMWDPKLSEYGFYRRQSHELTQAYRLYTLALAKKPDLASMNRLRNVKDLSAQARWRLAAAYALAGKKEVADQLIDGVSSNFEGYRELSYTYGSGIRDRAMALETILLLEDESAAANLVKYISEEMSSERWHGTQTIAYCLLSVGKYAGGNGIAKSFNFSYDLGNGKTINAGSNTPVFQVEIPIDEQNVRQINVSNTSKVPLFARVILKGQPLVGNETSAENDLDMQVNYKDTEGNSIDPASIAQGTDFIAEVSIKHPGRRPMPYKEMALDQIFPSGWEIMNTRMDNVQQFKQVSKYDYQDIRDDRVNTFFDVSEGQRVTYRVQLNAAYQGRFYLPATKCEAMYDASINARKAGQWVEVTAPKSI